MNGNRDKLIEIVGKGNFADDPESLEAYARDHSFVLPLRPRFVVKPRDVDEVREIVVWANQTRTPLVPVSSGPPHFYGDTVPSAPGAVMVDLSGMKRIIRIDRRNRMTMIEPGVTYTELQPELARAGLRLSTPLLPRANKSVVASLLEKQPTLVPRFQWAILDPLRCLEVVWGNGDRLMTGEAGSFGTLEEEWATHRAQVTPRGPGQVDFYKLVAAAQGSMGMVTWASVKCEVLPGLHRLFFVPAPRLDDLVDFTYRLLRLRFGDELLLLNGSNLASILGDDTDKIRALKEKLPPWVVVVGVAGRSILPRERVEFQEKDIREIAQQFGLPLLPALPGARGGEVLEVLLNPSREPYWKLGSHGGCRDIFFITTLDRTPGFVRSMYSLAEALNYSSSDLGVYLQPVHQGTSCHCEFNLPYDPEAKAEVARIKGLFTRASEELSQQGAFFYRPYGIWADMAFNRDAQTTNVMKKIKGIFDPNHVMNPGKLCF